MTYYYTHKKRRGYGSRSRILICFLFAAALSIFALRGAIAMTTADFTIEIKPGPQCYDGQDNDSDGKTDYPNDPGCASQSDDNETDDSGGGGGGGGYYAAPAITTTVIFSGKAYPKSTVTLLKDAQIIAATVAGPDAIFETSLTGISSGNYIFSLYGEDDSGNRSSLMTFPLSVTYGSTTNVSGIFIAPTIDIDMSEVKRGDNIAIFGQGVPHGEITIAVHSGEEHFVKTQADESGAYLYNFDTSPLEFGDHSIRSKAALGNELTPFSKSVSFVVGMSSIPKGEREVLKGDVNEDGRVNLVDFSIMAYWYKESLSVEFVQKEADYLSGDGIVDLVDFSIAAFYWTG